MSSRAAAAQHSLCHVQHHKKSNHKMVSQVSARNTLTGHMRQTKMRHFCQTSSLACPLQLVRSPKTQRSWNPQSSVREKSSISILQNEGTCVICLRKMSNLSLNQKLDTLPLKLRKVFCLSLLTTRYWSDVVTLVGKDFLLQAGLDCFSCTINSWKILFPHKNSVPNSLWALFYSFHF